MTEPRPAGRRRTKPARANLLVEPLEPRLAPTVQPVGLADPALYGTTGTLGAIAPAVSADGQLVAFVSNSDDLVPNDTDGTPDAFVFDRGTGTVTLVSVGLDGFAAGIDGSTAVAISPDGRYVTFESGGDARERPVGPGGNAPQVYVRDLSAGTTAVLSAASDGTPGNRDSGGAVFAADGHHVVFQSEATNLVPGVSYSDNYAAADLFERDLTTGVTTLVTRSLDGKAGVDLATGPFGVSADGRYVVFQSSASNLVATSNNGNEQVYVRDTTAGTTQLVTVGASGLEAGAGHNLLVDGPRAISGDGRYVVFQSNAANIVPGVPGGTQGFVRDLVAGTTALLTVSTSGAAIGGGGEVVSPDGRWAAFASATSGDPRVPNGIGNVYVRDLRTGAVTLASPNAAGTGGGNAHSGVGTFFDAPGGLSFSPDGRYLAFRSLATDLTAGVKTAARNLYLRDLDGKTTLLATPNAAGTDGGAGDADTLHPAVFSADGKVVAFESTAEDLVAGDANRQLDVFARDIAAGKTAAADARTPLLPAAFPSADGTVLSPYSSTAARSVSGSPVSDDGRYVAFNAPVPSTFFTAPFTPLAPGVTFRNDFTGLHSFVRDRQTGALAVLDLDPTGKAALGGVDPVISADGRHVAFLGYTNLLPAGVAYSDVHDVNVFVRDLTTNTTTLVSVDPTGTRDAPIAGVFDGELTISADGRYVAWTSIPPGAVAGVQPAPIYNESSVYLRDLKTGTTQYVSHDQAGDGKVNGRSDGISLSADGRFVVFRSTAPDLTANDANGGYDVFRWDRTTGAVALVSVNTAGTGPADLPSADQFPPVASADGLGVWFDSPAHDLIDQPDPRHYLARSVYRGAGGGPASLVFGSELGASYAPGVSADGGTVAFASAAHPTTDVEHTIAQQNVYASGPGGFRLLSQSIRPSGGKVVGPYTGNGDSGFTLAPAVSPDGRYVAFLSEATDLVPGFADANGQYASDLYVYDLRQGLIRAATIDQSGTGGSNADQDADKVTFSGDGGTLVFDSTAGNLLIGDRNGRSDVFAERAAGFASVAGRVFADDNANGTADAGEVGRPFWTVYADTDANGRLDAGEPAVITDATGSYKLTGLVPGAYTLRAVPQAGYIQTLPATPARAVTIDTDGTIVAGQDFGEYLPRPDLAVTAVSFAPSAAAPGDPLTVTWTVTDHGTAAADGDWQDAVFLSPTPNLGPAAVLAATVPHAGGLAVGAGYAGSSAVAVPPQLGTFYVIVRTDRRRQVNQGPLGGGRADDTLAAAGTLAVDATPLLVGMPASGTLAAAAPDRYYRVSAAAGRSLVLALAAADGERELYVKRGGLPTTADYDFAARGPGQPNPELTVPVAQGGDYYVLVHGRPGTGPFALTALQPGFGVRSVGRAGGNAGTVTVPVRGTDLSPTTAVSLVLGSTVVPAASVRFVDASLLYATFDLAGRPAGRYTVRVADGGRTADAADPFDVSAGRGSHLSVHLGTPSGIRLNFNPTADLEVDYANDGDADMPAPVFVLSVDKGGLEFLADGHPVPPSLRTVQFYGAGKDSPAGVLRAGDSGVVKVRLTIPPTISLGGGGGGGGVTLPGGSDDGVNVKLTTLPTDTTPIDWPSLKADLRPPTVAADAWDVIYGGFTAAVGSTTGQLQSALVADTAYLNQLGVADPSVPELLAFETLRADAALPVPTLAGTTDVAAPAPGLSLAFGRRFLQAISGRYAVSPLGRGWVSDWDVSASADADGNVLVSDAGVPRRFARQANGSYLASPGDHGTLYLTSGAYRLVEADGSVLQFRPDGKLDYRADPNGNRITAGYDGAGRLVTLTHSDGQALAIGYNALGRVASVTDPAGRTATYAYDAAGEHLLSVTTPRGTTGYAYVTGQGAAREHALASIAYPDGTHRVYTYDNLGRISGTARDGRADTVAVTYPSPGGVRFTDATGNGTTVEYDQFGRPARVTDPLGRTTRAAYDAAGNVVGVTLPGGLAYAYGYDAAGNLTRVTDPLGRTTAFAYGPHGTLTGLTDARGTTTRYGYDARGNLLSISYADGTGKRFAYDPLGDLSETINARGDAVGYAYNAAGQVTRVAFRDGSTLAYTYDARGNLATAADASGTTALTYDPADRLTEVAYPDGTFLRFAYDAGGRRIQSIDQTGYAVNYAYDAAGRLSTLTDAGGATVAAYAYDPAGRLAEKDLGNGTYATYAYDAAGELLHLVNHAPRPAVGQDGPVQTRFDYTYDARGNVATEATVDGTWAYTYDAIGELTRAVFTSANPAVLPDEDQAFEYDAAGNRTRTVIDGVTTTYTTNARNEYTQVGGTAYTYDADGNLATATTGGETTTYTFDALDRLTGVTDPTGTTTHAYDSLGDRAATTAKGVTTRFLNDPTGFGLPAGLAAVFGESAGAAVTHYAYGLGLESRTDAGGSAYYQFDQLGSVAGLTNAAGAVVNRYAYDPFGAAKTLTAGVANRFTFVGQSGVQADAGGLLKMGFREYASVIGQFASDDPIGLAGGDTNLRQYVRNSPTGFLDPLGLSPSDITSALNDYVTQHLERLAELEAAEAAGASAGAAGAGAGAAAASAAGGGAAAGAGAATAATGVGAVEGAAATLGGFGSYLGGIAVAATAGYFLGEFGGRVAADLNPRLTAELNFELAFAVVNDKGIGGALLRAFIPYLLPADPNNLVGPSGFGDDGFIPSQGQLLPYSVEFANDPKKATVAAEDVVVTVPLAPDLDWATFELGSIRFGSTEVPVPAGLQSYRTSVDTTNMDGTPLRVEITAALDRATGVVTWTFHSVDPATGDTPANPIAGFLPVDDATGRGEAFVGYAVRAKAGLATGTPLPAQASIVFDVNAPLATNAVLNTIDADAPTAAVRPLPATTTDPNIVVSWAGTDGAGSGVATYTVYTAADGGPLVPWLTNTAATSATYPGQVGHTYSFAVLATDNIGQAGATPAAQATTAVVVSPISPPPVGPPTTPPVSPPVSPPTTPPVSPPPTTPPVSPPPTTPPVSPPPAVPLTPPPVSPPADRTALYGTPAFAFGTGTVRVLNPDRSVRFSATPFPGFTGSLRTAVADFNGDGVLDLAVGTGPGTQTTVRVLDGRDGTTVLFEQDPFGVFGSGLYLAAGDVTGDGIADLIITPDRDGGPRVKVVQGGILDTFADFIGIGDPNFRDGAVAAVGDITGDGRPDLMVSAGVNGGPRIALYDGAVVRGTDQPPKLVGDFFAFDPDSRFGAYVALGDVDGDGKADLVFGSGPGAAPQVRILSGPDILTGTQTEVANFSPGSGTGGAPLVVKDLDGDGAADLVVGATAGASGRVTAYRGTALSGAAVVPLFTDDTDAGFTGGVFVG
jgi:RHS repeat-associated protein